MALILHNLSLLVHLAASITVQVLKPPEALLKLSLTCRQLKHVTTLLPYETRHQMNACQNSQKIR